MHSIIRTLSCSALVAIFFVFPGHGSAQNPQIQQSRLSTSVAYLNGPTEPDPDGGDVVKAVGHSPKPSSGAFGTSLNGPTEPDPDGGDVIEALKRWWRVLWISNRG